MRMRAKDEAFCKLPEPDQHATSAKILLSHAGSSAVLAEDLRAGQQRPHSWNHAVGPAVRSGTSAAICEPLMLHPHTERSSWGGTAADGTCRYPCARPAPSTKARDNHRYVARPREVWRWKLAQLSGHCRCTLAPPSEVQGQICQPASPPPTKAAPSPGPASQSREPQRRRRGVSSVCSASLRHSPIGLGAAQPKGATRV